MTKLQTQFIAARAVSTPLIAAWTADAAATVDALLQTQDAAEPAVLWDLVRGLRGLNKPGVAVVKALVGDEDPAAISGVPTDMLRLVVKAPRGTVVYALNLARTWDAVDVAQAVWNLRDAYKSNRRALVAVGPEARLPRELAQDVSVFVDPLPGRDELRSILASKVYQPAKIELPADREVDRLVDALAGLSAYAAEQKACEALTTKGVDLATLRDFRRVAIEATAGVSIYRGGQRFADLAGQDRIHDFFRRVRDNSKEPIKGVVFIDEIEKALAAAGAQGPGDSSGTAQYQLRQLLVFMQDRGAKGTLLYGIPGTGKTAFGKALANELDVELLELDLGAMQSRYVGASQEQTNEALRVVDAVCQGRALFVATCNSTAALPAELRRRFRTYGEWFFDTTGAEEQAPLVAIYLKRFGLEVTPDNPLPDITGWTGSEIESLIYLAYNLGLSFREAATFVVPMVTSAPEKVAELRKQAAGRFLAINRPGFYCLPDDDADASASRRDRAITLDDVAGAVVLGGMKES